MSWPPFATVSGKSNDVTLQNKACFRAPLCAFSFVPFNIPHLLSFSAFLCVRPSGRQAVRVTKPNIPESIRRNYELMWVSFFSFFLFTCCVTIAPPTGWTWCSPNSPGQVKCGCFKSVCESPTSAPWVNTMCCVTGMQTGNGGLTVNCCCRVLNQPHGKVDVEVRCIYGQIMFPSQAPCLTSGPKPTQAWLMQHACPVVLKLALVTCVVTYHLVHIYSWELFSVLCR